jgi:outer membrane protein TolC
MTERECTASTGCMMRTAFLTALIILLWASLITLFLVTEASAERVVGLREAVETAIRDNPAIRAMDNSVLAVREDIGTARGALLPRVTLEERYMRTNNPTFAFSSKLNQERFTQADFALDALNSPEAIGDFQTSVSIEQPVFLKEAYVRLDMAKKEAGALGLDLRRKKEAVALEVTRAYLGVQTAKEFLKAAERGLEDAHEHKRISEARFRGGLGLYSDTLRTDAFLKEAEERLIRARKNLQVAKRALGLLLGLEESLDVTDEGPEAMTLPVEEHNAMALRRSDIKALEKRLESAEGAVRLAKAGYLPAVGIGGTYQWNDHSTPLGGEGQSYQVMAFLRWTVFDGTRREHEKAKARYKAMEVSELLEGMRKEVLFRVYEAYLGVEEAGKALELACARERAAEEGRRLVRARYENSLSTVVDLLDAQSALDAARADMAGKRNDYLVSVSELRYRSGMILEDYIKEPEQ